MSSALTHRERVQLAIAAMCAALAVAFAVWPADWIEALTGKEPDGGDGSLERLPVLVLAALAVALASWVLVARARTRAQPVAVGEEHPRYGRSPIGRTARRRRDARRCRSTR